MEERNRIAAATAASGGASAPSSQDNTPTSASPHVRADSDAAVTRVAASAEQDEEADVPPDAPPPPSTAPPLLDEPAKNSESRLAGMRPRPLLPLRSQGPHGGSVVLLPKHDAGDSGELLEDRRSTSQPLTIPGALEGEARSPGPHVTFGGPFDYEMRSLGGCPSPRSTVGGWHSQISAEVVSLGVQVWPEWLEAIEIKNSGGSFGPSVRNTSVERADANIRRSGDVLQSRGLYGRVVTSPSATRKIIWDLLSFAMLGYDLMLIPMTAFDIPEEHVLSIMAHTVTIFWSCDIVLNFFVGFYDKGILELRPKPIAMRYLRSWFLLDVLIVGTDWFVFAMQDNPHVGSGNSWFGVARIGKSVRILRVLRMFRLLRILKLVSLLEELSDLIHGESLHTAFNVFKLIMAIAVVNHFIACGWFAVGNLDSDIVDTPGSWVRQQELSIGRPLTLGYKYSTSLHWSLTQFTPASMEVVPRNSAERGYSIVVILLALVMFSSFVSSITSSMTHLRAMREAQRKQGESVRKYVSDNKLSMDLSCRIQAFTRQNARTSAKKRIHEQDIPAFKFLPECLRYQMHCEIFLPKLLDHPLFRLLNDYDNGGLTKICHSAIVERSVLGGEELFTTGQKATHMYILQGGAMEYHDGDREAKPQHVAVGRRVAEIALWSAWEHQGRLVGVTVAELIGIDSVKFRTIIARRRRPSATMCADYALEYINRIVSSLDAVGHLSDIWDDWPTIAEVAQSCMPQKADDHGEFFTMVPAAERSKPRLSFINRLDDRTGSPNNGRAVVPLA